MSPLIMYMTSSLGSSWNSLRNSRPRATNAMLSGACHSTVLGRPELRILVTTCPRSTAFISSMDHPTSTETIDFLGREPEQVAQHAVRVLAEQGRRRAN